MLGGALYVSFLAREAQVPGSWIDEDDWAYFQTLGSVERRRQFCRGRWLLRQAVAQLFQTAPSSVRIKRKPNGAPQAQITQNRGFYHRVRKITDGSLLETRSPVCGSSPRSPDQAGPSVQVSLSHDGPYLAALASRFSWVGVDVCALQRLPQLKRVQSRILRQEEYALLGQTRDALGWIWASKEALVKTTQVGVWQTGLQNLQVHSLSPLWSPQAQLTGFRLPEAFCVVALLPPLSSETANLQPTFSRSPTELTTHLLYDRSPLME